MNMRGEGLETQKQQQRQQRWGGRVDVCQGDVPIIFVLYTDLDSVEMSSLCVDIDRDNTSTLFTAKDFLCGDATTTSGKFYAPGRTSNDQHSATKQHYDRLSFRLLSVFDRIIQIRDDYSALDITSSLRKRQPMSVSSSGDSAAATFRGEDSKDTGNITAPEKLQHNTNAVEEEEREGSGGVGTDDENISLVGRGCRSVKAEPLPQSSNSAVDEPHNASSQVVVNTDLVCTDIPSDRNISEVLQSLDMDGFHHKPSLWLKRMQALLAPPARYVLQLDGDVLPCSRDPSFLLE
jgi:hypothetical protein